MLNKIAFANAVAIVTALFYLVFYLLRFTAPAAFEFIFNAQFLGADIAALVPRAFSLANSLGVLVTLIVIGWVFGYVWAWLYNQFAR